MKITVSHIIVIVLLAIAIFPFIDRYFDSIFNFMIYFTFITNVLMWIITLRVYVFQQQLKENMDTPLLRKLFGRKKK